MYVNLLPAELVAQSRLVRATKAWGVALVLWTLTLVSVIAPLGVKSFNQQRELELLRSEVGPLRLKERKTQQLRNIAADLKKRSQRIRSVLPPNRIPSLLGIFGKTFQSEESPIALQDFLLTIQNDTKNNVKPSGNGVPLAGKPVALFSTQIIARGYTGTNPTVAEVIQRLERYGVFQMIQLRSTRDSFVANQQLDEFELECIYAE